MKIQGWPADKGGCAWWRIETPLGTLTDDDVDINIEMPHSVLDEPDRLLVLQRSCVPVAMMTLDEFQRKGRPWVYDIDDLLWKLTPDNPAHGYYIKGEIASRLYWHLRNAPLLTVSTAPLADEARAAGAQRVAVIPNCLPDRIFDHSPAQRTYDDGRVVVLWRGSPTHRKDIEVARYALKRLARREDVHLVFAGADYRKEMGVPDATHLPWVNSPEAYVHQILGLAPDIALCPLAPSRFNDCKSHVNALEASVAGAVPVCTDGLAYNSFVAHEEDGLLVRSNPDSWHRTLQALVDDTAGRRQMQAAARANAEQYRASQLKDQYRDLLASL